MTPGDIRFRRLALVGCVMTLLLASIGGLVRATGSGLGCRDEWPTCAGGWIAPLEYHSIIEYAHRAVAGIVVLLLVLLVIASWRWVRDQRALKVLSVVALAVVVFQAGLGRVVVTSRLHAALVTAHLFAALALVALTTVIAVSAYTRGRPKAAGDAARMFRLAVGAVAALLPLLVLGAYVRERGAGVVFGDWPLMGGRLIPSFDAPGAGLHFAHRVLALLTAAHLVSVTFRARRDDRRDVRTFAFAGVALFLAQALVGAANVWTTLHPVTVMLHASFAFLTWAAFIAVAVAAYRAPVTPAAGNATGTGVRDRVLAYAALTKPRIIVLLLVTTVPAMVLAKRGLPSLWLIVATLAGGMLTAGSANAFNQYLERDIDSKMNRTRSRPLPSHSVEPTRAAVFAFVLGVVGFVWLTVTVNLLSALLAISAIAFYVGVYTLLLKRSTPQNIVIGGAAGAVPVLVGWAAVTGTVGAPAWIMFGIIFLWTPPHFWALALRYRDDYAAAGVPMMPVVRGESSTTWQILVYAVVLVVFTLTLSPVGGLGALYALTAAALGAGFVYRALRLRWEPSPASAVKLFRYSISYLGLLFAAIAVDRLVW